jgi:hypothetical protein
MSAPAPGRRRASAALSARRDRAGLYLLVLCVALIATAYLALQVLGFLLKLAFLAAAALLAVAAARAWRRGA